jgi:signal-transduction protein with cAMP-binding, CBS, and nucleotidyltransferase domain
MQRVYDALDHKGGQVYGIGPNDMVYDAISMMAEREIGALVVFEHGKAVGIISERDYTRNVILKDKSSKQIPVSEIMTSDLITVTPQDHIDECVALMKEHHIRHLPVTDQGAIVGVLSLRDLFSKIIDEQAHVIEDLEHYVRGEV